MAWVGTHVQLRGDVVNLLLGQVEVRETGPVILRAENQSSKRKLHERQGAQNSEVASTHRVALFAASLDTAINEWRAQHQGFDTMGARFARIPGPAEAGLAATLVGSVRFHFRFLFRLAHFFVAVLLDDLDGLASVLVDLSRVLGLQTRDQARGDEGDELVNVLFEGLFVREEVVLDQLAASKPQHFLLGVSKRATLPVQQLVESVGLASEQRGEAIQNCVQVSVWENFQVA